MRLVCESIARRRLLEFCVEKLQAEECILCSALRGSKCDQQFPGGTRRMQLKTILNRIQRHRYFVYGTPVLREEQEQLILDVPIFPRARSRPFCSGCMRRRPLYDHLDVRRFEFVPLWGILVYFLYAMRRVDCRSCGIVVEAVPWATGKRHVTTTYAWFLAGWAKRMSWSEVGQTFRTSWDTVYRSVEMAVAWGRAHVSLDGISAIGLDEIALRKGQKYLTLVYQIDEGCKRLLWLGAERKEQTLDKFFDWLGEDRAAGLRFVCSDMWAPYLAVIARRAAHAVHILDRFHIMSNFSKAIDKVRSEEARELKALGIEILKGSRWTLLKRPENLTFNQDVKLADLLRYNLRTIRSYLLKEEFQVFWTYKSAFWGSIFLDWWCRYTMRSRIEPMKGIARMLRNHQDLVLNWFKAHGRISAGAVEGLNNKAKLTSRKAYGFREFKTAEVALFHTLGKLPEPKVTHRFC